MPPFAPLPQHSYYDIEHQQQQQQQQQQATTTQDENSGDKSHKNDDIEQRPCREFCQMLLFQVVFSSTVIALYLYWSMAVSKMYLLGLIASVGVDMMVQGHMRDQSLRQMQALYLSSSNKHDDNENNHIKTTTGHIVERSTDGWDPVVACHCQPHLCGTKWHCQVEHDSNIANNYNDLKDDEQDNNDNNKDDKHLATTIGSLYHIVVQYTVEMSNPNDTTTTQQQYTVVKEFPKVPVDVFYSDAVPLVYLANQPLTAQIPLQWQPLSQGGYAPSHQNGRCVLGAMACLVALLLSAYLLPWGRAEWLAIGANVVVMISVAFLVYRRSLFKHESLVRGGGARIVSVNNATGVAPKEPNVGPTLSPTMKTAN